MRGGEAVLKLPPLTRPLTDVRGHPLPPGARRTLCASRAGDGLLQGVADQPLIVNAAGLRSVKTIPFRGHTRPFRAIAERC